MKSILALCCLMLLFSGCSLWSGQEYIKVQPHDEGYEVAIDSNAVTVSSYLGLKNAMLDFVAEGVEEGVIRAESYPGEITEDLDSAVYEIWRGDPLGAYAVDYMTYDCTKIANKYEIHIHTTYRRSAEELAQIVYASDLDSVALRVAEAMETYSQTLTLRMGTYEDMDIQQVVSEVYQAHPEFALELPQVTMTTYPDSGTQRIVEIQFLYETDSETLETYRTQMHESLDLISQLYGSQNNDEFCAHRLYNRVRRDGVLLNQQEADSPFAGSPYGVLEEEKATSLGYAQTYQLLMDRVEIPCAITQCFYMGQIHYLCRFTIDDETWYADPSPTVMPQDYDPFMLSEDDLESYGYEIS